MDIAALLIVSLVSCFCCVAILALIGVGVYFFMQQQKNNQPATAPSAAPFSTGATPPPPASPFGSSSSSTPPPPASPFDRPATAMPHPPAHEQTMIMMEPDEPPSAPRGDARSALDSLNAPGKPYIVGQESAFSYAIGLNPPAGDYRLNIALDEANGVARLMETGSSELASTIRADVEQVLLAVGWRVL